MESKVLLWQRRKQGESLHKGARKTHVVCYYLKKTLAAWKERKPIFLPLVVSLFICLLLLCKDEVFSAAQIFCVSLLLSRLKRDRWMKSVRMCGFLWPGWVGWVGLLGFCRRYRFALVQLVGSEVLTCSSSMFSLWISLCAWTQCHVQTDRAFPKDLSHCWK